MEYTLYLTCAVAGCTLVGLQVVLQVFGFFGDLDATGADAHVDVGIDGDAHVGADLHGGAGVEGHGNVFFGILSFKALCAFAGIFGLVGLMLHGGSISLPGRLALSFGAGIAGMLIVAWMMRGMSRLQASGSLDLRNAVGRTGTVYLRVPARNSGRGKVTVEVQGRSIELPAFTEGEEIPTGRRVSIVALEGESTLKVVPIEGGV